MTQMSIALRASDFDANHAVARISDLNQVCPVQGLPETRPTATRIELTVAPKEWKTTANAGVRTHAPFDYTPRVGRSVPACRVTRKDSGLS